MSPILLLRVGRKKAKGARVALACCIHFEHSGTAIGESFAHAQFYFGFVIFPRGKTYVETPCDQLCRPTHKRHRLETTCF